MRTKREKGKKYIQKEKYEAENKPGVKTTDIYIQGIDDKIGCQKNLEQHQDHCQEINLESLGCSRSLRGIHVCP